MKKLLVLSTLALWGVLGCNNANRTATNTDTVGANALRTPVDQEVNESINEVLNEGATQVELSKLAETHALNPRVRNFGSMIVRDNTKVGDELKVIAANKNIITAQVLEGEHLEEVELLRKETGQDFDKEYIKIMLKSQREYIDKVEDMAKDDKNPDLQAFANKTLPQLRTQLDSVRAIDKEVKGNK